MRGTSWPACFAFAFSCLLLWAPPASGQQGSSTGTPHTTAASRVTGPIDFYFCLSQQIGRGHTAYISNIFAAHQQNSKSQMSSEYLIFLMKRYSYPSRNAGCFGGYRTEEAARAIRQTQIEQFGRIQDKVVETPWKYSAALSEDEIPAQQARVSPPLGASSHLQETASQLAPSQNVDVTSLGPAPQIGGFDSLAMTPDFRNIALTGPSGSRMSGFLDGHAGGKYDEVLTVPPVVSADGRRWAYAARRGSQWFAVVDGKEYGPYDRFSRFSQGTSSNNRPLEFQPTPRWPIVFSPDSKHFAFIADKGNATIAVEDGKEISVPGNVVIESGLLFSKQGDHLVFVTRDTAGRWSAVVMDGIAGPRYETIYWPRFSDDGHHLVYVAMKTPLKYTVVEDGKEGPLFDSIANNDHTGKGILISSDGAHLAYFANRTAGPDHSFVVIDGRMIPNADHVWMTPDGKSIAYLTSLQTGMQYQVTVVANGKPGLEYGSLKDLRFAPDGHVIYAVTAPQTAKTFVVDGDKELGPYDNADLNTLHFSADGEHMAYVAQANGQSFVVLDDKRMSGFIEVLRPPAYNMELAYKNMLHFTPEGQVVYHARTVSGDKLVEDSQILGDDGLVSPDGRREASVKATAAGTMRSAAQLTLDGHTGPGFYSITKMAFSPDSKHFAYVGTRPVPNGNDGGYFLMVDGVQKGEYPEISDLQFSPDSQHLFHFTTSHLHGGPGSAYMDQKLFFIFNWGPGYFVKWLDDHRTLQIIGIGGKYDPATMGAADSMAYRVRYFLPGANHDQETVTSSGSGAVDLQEARRMLGSTGGTSALANAAPPASSAPTAANASAGAAASGRPTSVAPSAQNVPLPGTTVEVKLIDAVDSAKDSAGKRYRAIVTKAVNAGSVVIPQGAAATVTLARNGAGWVAQLSSLTINGQAVAVSSSSASVTGGAQNTVDNAASAAKSVLGRFGGFGRRTSIPQGVATVISGQRVVLPPGISLTFVLGGAAQP